MAQSTGQGSLDWSIQPPYLHPDYKSTVKRAPKELLVPMPQTLSELTGPVYGTGDIKPLDNDLTRNAAHSTFHGLRACQGSFGVLYLHRCTICFLAECRDTIFQR